jgi:hypothetical protein
MNIMTQSSPILSFIEGIDDKPRYLTSAEVDQLTQPGAPSGRGDWFAQWLAATPVDKRQLTLRSFLTEVLPDGSYTPFGVADGLPIVYDHANPSNPLNSVSRHMRFIIVAVPDSPDLSNAITTRTLCIVASHNLDGQDQRSFLQCASWDPHALGPRMGLMRFYQRNTDGWMYFGDSFNAVSFDLYTMIAEDF